MRFQYISIHGTALAQIFLGLEISRAWLGYLIYSLCMLHVDTQR